MAKPAIPELSGSKLTKVAYPKPGRSAGLFAGSLLSFLTLKLINLSATNLKDLKISHLFSAHICLLLAVLVRLDTTNCAFKS